MAVQAPVTTDEFAAFVQRRENLDKRFELIDGEIVDVPSNPYVSVVAGMILYAIRHWLIAQGRAGYVAGADGGFVASADRRGREGHRDVVRIDLGLVVTPVAVAGRERYHHTKGEQNGAGWIQDRDRTTQQRSIRGRTSGHGSCVHSGRVCSEKRYRPDATAETACGAAVVSYQRP